MSHVKEVEKTVVETPAQSAKEVEKSHKTVSAKTTLKDSHNERCPHGMRFGIDTDKDPKWCDKCVIWDQCLDVKESGGNDLPF